MPLSTTAAERTEKAEGMASSTQTTPGQIQNRYTSIQHPTEPDTIPRPNTAQEQLRHKRKHPQLDTASHVAAISHPSGKSRQPPTLPPLSQSMTRQGHGYSHPRTLESLDISDFTATPSQQNSRSTHHHRRETLSQHGVSLNLADRRKATLSQISKRFALPSSAPRSGGIATTLQLHSQNTTPTLNSTAQPPIGKQAPTAHLLDGSGNSPRTSGHSTAPLLGSATVVNQPRGRTTSELAKTIVLPPMNSMTTHQGKKKIKFNPPVIRGGYTEKFLRFYENECAEHNTWSNAYLRQVKIFGTSAPEAIVEIIELFRDHNIILSKCRIVPHETSSNDQPEPLEMDVDVVPESPQFQPLEKEPPDISVAVCDQMDTFNSAGQDALIRELNRSEAEQANEGEQPLSLESVTNDSMANVKSSSRPFCPDDSISGLHTDLERLAFLVSSQGSEMGTQPLTQRRILEELDHFKPSMLTSQMPSGSSIATFQTADENKGMVMPSSQGSDDGLNDVDQDLHDTHHQQHQDYLHDNTTRSARASPELISDPIDPIDPAQVKGDNDAPSNSSAKLSKAASVTVDGPIAANQQSVEVIELADDSVHTDSSEKVAENDLLPKQSTLDALSSVTSNTSPLPDPALSTKESEIDPHEEVGHDFDRSSYIYVLFSNAFHWSVLSVMDRVEIHAPLRKIQLMGVQSQESSVMPLLPPCQSIWVAERYRVVSSGPQ